MNASFPKTIPWMPGLPFIGNILAFRFQRLALFKAISATCGDIGGFHIGPVPLILLNAAEYVEAVLVTHADRAPRIPRLNQHLAPFLGQGLLTSDGAPHAQQRKQVRPSFQPRQIAGFAGMMVEYAAQTCASWADGTVVAIDQEMFELTLRIIDKALFQVDIISNLPKLGDAFTTATHFLADTAAISAAAPFLLRLPTRRNRTFQQAITRVDAAIALLITQRRKMDKPEDNLLDVLLQTQDADGYLSDRQLRDHLVTLFFAGHETTANALAWTWYLLARHPHCYRRMRDEVDGVLGDRLPTVADMAQLPYTRQVIQEALRFYPPAYAFGRKLIAPIDLGHYQLPTGAGVIICPYTLHRRPDYFPDPERFDPDRFTSEAEKQRPRMGYIPFGAGMHHCIGQHFALLETQLILATLTQQVLFELVPGQRIVPEPLITLRPRGGIRMIVRRRQHAPTL